MLQVLLIILLFFVFVYWMFFFSAYALFKNIKSNETPSLKGVSVIISCKNGEETIDKTINAVLTQEYHDFELIVIDDFSTDGTLAILQKYQDPRLVVLSAIVDIAGKKAALTQAIHQAKNEILLFTDADCIPASTHWIVSMVNTLLENSETEVVLGYGPMYQRKSWINTFARYETWLTAIQYFSYAMFKMPYMGVGRNLMYKKSTFIRVNGFSDHEHIASGDDDLLITSVANRNNVAINIDPNAFVYSEAKDRLSTFLGQKTRHITTSVSYKFIHQVLLSIFAVTQVGIYFILILGLISNTFVWQSVFVILLSKWIIQSIFHFKWMQRLDSKDLVFLFPVLDVLMCVYYMVVTIYSLFKKKRSW